MLTVLLYLAMLLPVPLVMHSEIPKSNQSKVAVLNHNYWLAKLHDVQTFALLSSQHDQQLHFLVDENIVLIRLHNGTSHATDVKLLSQSCMPPVANVARKWKWDQNCHSPGKSQCIALFLNLQQYQAHIVSQLQWVPLRKLETMVMTAWSSALFIVCGPLHSPTASTTKESGTIGTCRKDSIILALLKWCNRWMIHYRKGCSSLVAIPWIRTAFHLWRK